MTTSVPSNQPLNLFEYQRLAKARMSPQGYDYYAAGAMDEITLEANRRSYDEIFLRPRVLTGVGNVDTKTTVLGSDLTMPVIVAPSAFHGLATPLAERATAGAAATAGIVYCMSTMANTRMEDVATVGRGRAGFSSMCSRIVASRGRSSSGRKHRDLRPWS